MKGNRMSRKETSSSSLNHGGGELKAPRKRAWHRGKKSVKRKGHQGERTVETSRDRLPRRPAPNLNRHCAVKFKSAVLNSSKD